jgi:hypothetical protein
MALLTPEYLQTKQYPAKTDRFTLEEVALGERVMGRNDLMVVQRGAGANMSVDVLAGAAWVQGDSIARQGLYHVVNDATTNVSITAADPTNPRLDTVCLKVNDSTDGGDGSDTPTFTVVAGTPTAGATLDNRNGAGALPATAIHLADVLVATSDTSITNAEIRSRRPLGPGVGHIYASALDGTGGDWSLIESPYAPMGTVNITNTFDLDQQFVRCRTSVPLVNLNRFGWVYTQGPTTAMTGNYNIGIYDTSGRLLTSTGSTAFAGAALSIQARVETLTTTINLPAGDFILGFGADYTNAGNYQMHAIGTIPSAIVIVTNWGDGSVPVVLTSPSGGLTLPTHLGSLGTPNISAASPGVPWGTLRNA